MEAFQPLSDTSDVSALFSIHGDLPLKHTRNFLGPNRTLGAETKLNCVTMRISFKYVRLVSFVDIFLSSLTMAVYLYVTRNSSKPLGRTGSKS